ncbi:molybdopterin-synthase adenylyltransferase MoeB [Neiella marina]|uniref:Molybdopterin-synthase adenylyltransferase MoeB n=1 Tax=Neiella marina TaxID=508461 RepID=A0A8J2U9Z1_9GAMM|nr:HesA/MoeB/ThiF family protein [Neiella marina]GGA88318.1 molybdopterin-synthase adenylyltransferase MoeB [Neiella marina]
MLTDHQTLRYSRHLLLQQVGEDGQLKLQQAKVLLIGLGGLGSPAGLYLAAAGIGELHLVDHDQVELSNLQRQILYRESDVGEDKVEAAERQLSDLNDDIELVIHAEKVTANNAPELVQGIDVVLDCTDNFAVRHVINAACQQAGVPLVSGAAIRLEGQLSVFDFRDSQSPCYACLYPPSGQEPKLNCANSGVIGPVLGVIASLQALAAIKLLLGLPVDTAKLQLFDALHGDWQQFAITRSANCPVCAAR